MRPRAIYLCQQDSGSDCDDDTLIYRHAWRTGVCHTGHRTCFFTTLWEAGRKVKGEQYYEFV